MKLYDTKQAPNPRRVRIFLAEKGIEVPVEQIDLLNMECQTDDFTVKNPMQRVPVLELDDGTCISESVAICRYFEETNPEPVLFGRDAKEKAEVEMWNRRMEQNFFGVVAAAFRHSNEVMARLEVPQVPDWAQANLQKIDGVLTWLDGVLGDREFIAGENYSIADITALCAVDFMRVVGKKLDDLPNITRWRDAMKTRPSYGA